MKGRILAVFVLLAMATAGCAEPGLVGGDAVAQETESGTDVAVSDDTRSSEGTLREELVTDPESASAKDISIDLPIEDAVADTDDQTTTALVTATDGQKTPPTAAVPSPPPEDTLPSTAESSTLVEKAKADLANRLGVSADLIDVTSVQQVEWPGRGFGCPEPGKLYAQVISMGWQIILSYEGKTYSYHSGGGGDPFYCAKPSNPLPGS